MVSVMLGTAVTLSFLLLPAPECLDGISLIQQPLSFVRGSLRGATCELSAFWTTRDVA